jgi:hypothetical protein
MSLLSCGVSTGKKKKIHWSLLVLEGLGA